LPIDTTKPTSNLPREARDLGGMVAANSAYGADQIQVLEGLEAVRKRPGMYIGGTGLSALHHLVYEVVDNSIDEAMAGFATRVEVTLHADGSVSVTDDGRGIPVEPKKHENPAYDGKPAIEIAMTVLHAGGKFGQEGSAYKVSGGLHGVGVSCVNALSSSLEAEVLRDGKIHRIAFCRGKVTDEIAVLGQIPPGSPRRTGTKVTFLPDTEIFPDTEFSYATLSTRLRELSYLNNGVMITLTDERVGVKEGSGGKSEIFHAKDGLREYIEHLMHGKTPVTNVVYIRREDKAQSLVCEVALQYHDGYNETLLTFANNINNKDGGTHGAGFKVALTRTVNAYARKSGIIREKDPVPTGEDLREGLVAIVSVKLPSPTFNNQPKEKLLNPEIEAFVASCVNEALGQWMDEHPGEAKRLCLKGIVAAQAREAARKARELTRRKSALDSGSMPHKLRDCKTKEVERSEIYIVEGDSAGGSATQGRDVETQAILPLKGKILNVEKARIDKMLAHEEIQTLISALRCGIGEDFDASKIRYGKVIIMTDADVDGSHIRTLLLTFFFRQMPELIRRGRIYCAQPPLYLVARGKSSRYVLNERVLHEALTELGLEGTRLAVRTRDASGRIARGAKDERMLEGANLHRLVRVLDRLSELVEVSQRRGVLFPDMLATRASDPTGKGRLPTHRVSWRGGSAWAWSEAEALTIAANVGSATSASKGPPIHALGTVAEPPQVRELHENRELERVFAELTSLGLDIDDYAITLEETVSGERMPARFAWLTDAASSSSAASAKAKPVSALTDEEPVEGEKELSPAQARRAALGGDGRVLECENLAGLIGTLHEIGRRGQEIKRFKGLGEMDAEQLWVTTMDPTKRSLMRVTWDIASDADSLFTILMGEEVEPRRKFIEDHALEVKNLDV
jgi:DNA gyrase subunit B